MCLFFFFFCKKRRLKREPIQTLTNQIFIAVAKIKLSIKGCYSPEERNGLKKFLSVLGYSLWMLELGERRP